MDQDRYKTASLNTELINRVKVLEKDLRMATDKDIILIAYEEDISPTNFVK